MGWRYYPRFFAPTNCGLPKNAKRESWPLCLLYLSYQGIIKKASSRGGGEKIISYLKGYYVILAEADGRSLAAGEMESFAKCCDEIEK